MLILLLEVKALFTDLKIVLTENFVINDIVEDVKTYISNFLHLTNHYHPQDDVSIKILGKYSQTESLAKVYQFFFADLNWKSFPNI